MNNSLDRSPVCSTVVRECRQPALTPTLSLWDTELPFRLSPWDTELPFRLSPWDTELPFRLSLWDTELPFRLSLWERPARSAG